jgi:hypothetical protein
MIYQTHQSVPVTQLDKLLNTLAEAGWRLHSILPNGSNFTVIMQIEKGEINGRD